MKNEIIILQYSLIDYLFLNGEKMGLIERQYETEDKIKLFHQSAKKLANDYSSELEIKRVTYNEDFPYDTADRSVIPCGYDIYVLYK